MRTSAGHSKQEPTSGETINGLCVQAFPQSERSRHMDTQKTESESGMILEKLDGRRLRSHEHFKCKKCSKIVNSCDGLCKECRKVPCPCCKKPFPLMIGKTYCYTCRKMTAQWRDRMKEKMKGIENAQKN